jgi:hypothetical protein
MTPIRDVDRDLLTDCRDLRLRGDREPLDGSDDVLRVGVDTPIRDVLENGKVCPAGV